MPGPSLPRSLPLLDRYILRYLFLMLAALTGGAVALIWLTQSLHFISMVVEHGLSLSAFLHLTSLMVPNFVSIILPISTFLVILFVYQKLEGDRELTVMQAAGFSPFRLARPGLICAFLATGLCYFLSLWGAPASYHAFHRYEFEIRNRVAAFLLEEGVFTPISSTMTIYVRQRETDTVFDGILIQDNRVPAHPTTILAERAAILPHNNAIQLVLYNGSRQEIDSRNGQLSMLNFSHDMIELGPSHTAQKLDEDAAELSLHTLFSPPADLPARYRGKLLAEGWQRLTSPLSTLSYAMIGLICVLRGRFSRHGSIIRPFCAILCVVGLLTLSLMLKGMVARSPVFIIFLWGEFLLPIIVGLSLLTYDQYRGHAHEIAVRSQEQRS
ncbi:LPS export ABC transporter permease LptF [Saccharibacter sp. 17.LH.SD]|uniref:LPS export ABC transporter permease LptF n=1 Tax=Saccharibacter sp. 17.LH.SD TaxID=2689393 RepID=UPI001368B7F8|nr:LPS export ABC transporter permease LptF [Saccharibacter sp. 17.LH.SD]MXV44774.1 LPS export ABC transporter permease LptF [Saccharibacter sp. 17.LH.SD]